MKKLSQDGNLFSSRARLPEGTVGQVGRMDQRDRLPQNIAENW